MTCCAWATRLSFTARQREAAPGSGPPPFAPRSRRGAACCRPEDGGAALGVGEARSACVLESREVLRHVRAASREELPMDTQAVIAVCEILLVIIGIIGLVLVRRE